jgi:hypothetical protein
MALGNTPWLDVHVIVSATTYQPWQRRCFQSIEMARLRANFPVAIHYIHGVPGHIGIMRYQAYRKGNAPYVCNVDDDDYLLDNAFLVLRDPILQGADAIFPKEWQCRCAIKGDSVNEGPLEEGRQHHSMKVFQRRHLIDHRPWTWASDVAQMKYLETLPNVVDIPTPTYVWRVYSQSNSMPLRLRRPSELRRARAGEATLLNP